MKKQFDQSVGMWWDELLQTAKEKRIAAAKRSYKKAMRLTESWGANHDIEVFRSGIDLLMEADMNGYPPAGYHLGVFCEKTNPERAESYYKSIKKSMIAFAEECDAEAQFCLAEMYRFGRGISPNEDISREWAELSARNGNAKAAKLLSDLNNHKMTERCVLAWESLLAAGAKTKKRK